MVRRPHLPTAISRATTPRFIRTRVATKLAAQILPAVLVSRRHRSHCTPETPGSIHEGGELGYSISHAYGAAFDNPDLIVTVAIGDGEAETGPLATSWHSNKFLNPIRDGAVLPVLHLNGYKIANPTVLGRIPHEELESLLIGYGHQPYFVEGDDPSTMHQKNGFHSGAMHAGNSLYPAACPRNRRRHASPMADDRAAFAQRLDRTEGSRRPQSGGFVAGAPGSSGRPGHE